MIKKRTTKINASRRRATVSGGKKPANQPKYRHYSSYQPPKPSDATTQRHRGRVIATVVVAMAVIISMIAAKIFVDSSPSAKTDNPAPVGGVEQSKNIEAPSKSPIELSKEQAEQQLNAIGDTLKTSAFSTDNIVKLTVPIYKQVYAQSCEATSLRMALAYRGIETTDLDVLKLMNYDDQPAKKVDDKWIWGNPHQMFVGDKDGNQAKMTGYGVFGEPIAAASEQLGRPAVVQTGVEPAWLAKQIYAGNPIILWGVSVKIADARWTTSTGEDITAPMRTHTRLVIGVKGDPNQPTGFWLNDPAGTVIYWTTAQLLANVQQGVGQAVVIY